MWPLMFWLTRPLCAEDADKDAGPSLALAAIAAELGGAVGEAEGSLLQAAMPAEAMMAVARKWAERIEPP
jgi:hypothetical protein